MMLAVTIMLVLAAVGLGMLLRRWRRATDKESGGTRGLRDELDDRIDAELAEVD